VKAKAVFATERDTVKLQEFELDEGAIRPEQLLIETRCSVISPGTELDCVSGREASWFHFPQQLGYCAVGKVLSVGSSVSGYAPGDIVLTPTAHASHALIEVDMVRAQAPEGMDPQQAVWAHLALIAMTALRASSAELGDYAAVIGQGLIGVCAAQLFRAQGCRVIAVDRIAARLELARRCGVELVVDASKGEAAAAVKQLTGGRGAEVVVEATGSAAGALEGLEMAARNGEMILLGTPRGSYEADVIPLLRAVHRASPNLTLKGAHGYSIPQAADPWVKHSVARNAVTILDMIQRGEFVVEPLLSRVVKPEQAPEAYRELRAHPDRLLGVVFDWTT
jgi:threonine dehydrogenase-like Zn-dependent dehydrogenase